MLSCLIPDITKKSRVLPTLPFNMFARLLQNRRHLINSISTNQTKFIAPFCSRVHFEDGSSDKLLAGAIIAGSLAATFVVSDKLITSNSSATLMEAALPVKVEELKEYSMADVKSNDGKDGKPIWVTYGGMVYNITDFISNHPGGSEKIIQAAGGPVEPWWNLYRQHFSTDLPMVLMDKMVIGKLAESDQASVDEYMERVLEEDPYAMEPDRDDGLRVHSETPMNAESPYERMLDSYLTPNELFYIRHHHPVPLLSEEQIRDYRLKVDLSELGLPVKEFSLEDLKAMPKHEVVVTLQCSGNRRGGYNEIKRTSGTSWYQGAISTAKWGGVKLRDVLEAAGLKEGVAIEKGLEHVRFQSIDGLKASIDLAKAMSLYGDCLVAYEMNGEDLPRDHGFPVRSLIPGYVGVRNVKWLNEIQVSSSEAEGAWQRGLNYKTLPPSVTDVNSVDLTRIPAMQEASIFSGITNTEFVEEDAEMYIEARGWAWAGGGRNVVRVDVSADNGGNWITADIYEGGDQKFNRGWAWVFWKAKVPVNPSRDGKVELCSKAVDIAYNIQPEKPDWNVRGLGNNSWFRKTVETSIHER